MTREEALRKTKGYLTDIIPQEDYAEVEEIIKALEKEPCEDAISREELLKKQYRIDDSATLSTRDVVDVGDIEDLPSVTPIRRKGEWETGYTYPDGVYWKCSVCKELIRVRIPMHFCSNCGSKMIRKRKKE